MASKMDNYDNIVDGLCRLEFVTRALESGADLSGLARSGAVLVLEGAITDICEALEDMCAH